MSAETCDCVWCVSGERRELIAALTKAQAWMFKALQAFEGWPDPSENEGKNIDAEVLALLSRCRRD